MCAGCFPLAGGTSRASTAPFSFSHILESREVQRLNERIDGFERRLAELEKRLAGRRSQLPGPAAGFPPGTEPAITQSEGELSCRVPNAPCTRACDPSPASPEYFRKPRDGVLEETSLIRHNQLGETYSVKLVYPGFYLAMRHEDTTCTVGFPAVKERLAKRITPGHLFFIYVTSPERRLIGMAQASGPAEFAPERDFKRPWALDLHWVIGPKSPGVQFSDIGLQVKARVGDSTYSITEEVAAAIIERLQGMDDLGPAELEKQKERYRMFA